MLGVLAAAGAALRPLGAGTAGLEPMFFLMVLSGRVLGPGFGFVLGSVTMFASALLTGGVGPVDAVPDAVDGLVHDGRGPAAGPGPAARPRPSCCCSPAYGAVAAFAYGTVMNLQGWPYIGGLASGVSFDPGRPARTRTWPASSRTALATSLGWDLGRAVAHRRPDPHPRLHRCSRRCAGPPAAPPSRPRSHSRRPREDPRGEAAPHDPGPY